MSNLLILTDIAVSTLHRISHLKQESNLELKSLSCLATFVTSVGRNLALACIMRTSCWQLTLELIRGIFAIS